MNFSYFYKTIIVPIKCNKQDMRYLSGCNKLSARVWNLCIELNNKYRELNDGRYMGRSELQKQTKKCVPLHAKGIQHVVHKYLFARDAMFKSNNVGTQNVKVPYKIKKYFVTGWCSQSIKTDYERGVIFLSKPNRLDGEENRNKKQAPIKCYVKTIPENIVEIELVYKDRLCLAIKYKEELSIREIASDNQASIDLGEIHAITSIDSCGNAIIITGRKMRSIKRLRNKEQGKIYKRLRRCTKGSRQYKRYMRALWRLKNKSNRQISDSIHKVSKLYSDFCIENKISIVYFGDLDSATRGTKQTQRVRRKTRQKLSQWEYGELIKQLENKLTRYGIELIKVKEYHTSQTCPSCSIRNKPTNREYLCECGYKQHRDIVGAINILNFNTDSELTHYKSKKYLRIA